MQAVNSSINQDDWSEIKFIGYKSIDISAQVTKFQFTYQSMYRISGLLLRLPRSTFGRIVTHLTHLITVADAN